MPTNEDMWSEHVKVKWHPPQGFFLQDSDKIAHGLKAAHPDYRSAMGSLDFYINRAGKGLSAQRKATLEKAKAKLASIYGRPVPENYSPVITRASRILNKVGK